MDDTLGVWFVTSFGDLDEVAVLVLVVGALGLRIAPSTRRWAPRGNARPIRRGSDRLTELAAGHDLDPEPGGAHDAERVARRSSIRA
ncbi:hypothetical protein J2S59_003893 [Nocardioides massiliensis]|uniref:Uncharacterized protein n=1 Tax=Nocardioides massiliensis TaxID=1325935 RepID=A0ABT9NVA2_9ACTN|nr:hypothetical protein [Nocardioides massiliensis]